MDSWNRIFAGLVQNLNTIVGVIALFLAYVFYRKSRRLREPCWSVRNNVLVEGYSSKIHELDIRFKDNQVENLSIAHIAFWNQGAETLDRHDIETVNPLRIEASGGIEILDVSVSLTNNSSSEIETKPASDRKSARLGFDYLNKGQGAIIQVIHTGIKGSDVRIIGDIRGVKQIKKKSVSWAETAPRLLPRSNFVKKLPSSRRKSARAVCATGAFLNFATAVVVFISKSDLEDYLGLLFFLFVYGFILLAFAIFLSRTGLPRGLEAIEDEPLL